MEETKEDANEYSSKDKLNDSANIKSKYLVLGTLTD